MDMQKYLDLFVSEANEHLEAAGKDVSHLASGLTPREGLNSLFRHFHSIKGMAASMGYEPIASLSHAVEDLLDRLRKAGQPPPEPLTDLVMEALDSTSAMVEQTSGGALSSITIDPSSLIERIRALMPEVPPRSAASSALVPVTGSPRGSGSSGSDGPGIMTAPAAPETAASGGEARRFHCMIVIDPRAEFAGARAALVLKRLERVGRIVSTTPPQAGLSSTDFDGEVRVELATDRPEGAVLAAVQDLLDLKRFELAEELPQPRCPPAADARRGGSASGHSPSSSASTVRIPTATLDRFLDSISEMIARRGTLAEAIRTKEMQAAREALRKLSDSIQELRDQVLLIRLLPFEQITPRLTQTVRDLCRRTGKRITLEITGSDVSLDRSVLEEILDPLNHILRNAVDHGIELPRERELAGKPPGGTVRLRVSRDGDRAIVVVEDDGRGMDLDAIRSAAVAGGFASEADLSAMDEPQILLLTTIPGFSTATKVTDLSGRGVGMDVVRTRVEALRGHMTLSSRRGAGTRIEMSLPVSVAVIDAFLVDCRSSVFAVPACSVAGVQLVEPERIRTTLAGSYLAPLQEQDEADSSGFTPLVRLDEALGLPDPPPISAPMPALSFEVNNVKGVLAVERIRERRELVVKPLGAPLERLRRYSGVALLDDGSMALILDLASLTRSR